MAPCGDGGQPRGGGPRVLPPLQGALLPPHLRQAHPHPGAALRGLGQLLRSVQRVPPWQREHGAAQPVAVGHGGRVHLPVPVILPVPLQARDEEPGGDCDAQGLRPDLGRAGRDELPAGPHRQVGHRGAAQGGEGEGRAPRGGRPRPCGIQRAAHDGVLRHAGAAARALPPRGLHGRARRRGPHQPSPQRPLHQGSGLLHQHGLLRRVRLYDEQALHGRGETHQLRVSVHRPNQGEPAALHPLRADPQEERADVCTPGNLRGAVSAVPPAGGGR
mmetsp:Transcript_8860/g.29321  ORF Transcript_8860/g.29321 Transcript_8860/m.29321 type:complete len:274 (-) Transcript_8860:153-974(-)